MKRLLSILLTLAAALSFAVPALASSYTDVADGAWYAEAVEALIADLDACEPKQSASRAQAADMDAPHP